ncbi:MAG: Acetate kinase [Nitrospira sp.]|nr:acetate/propionate family kinase [Nitrospira sp.]ULA61853.1 MAG: Acetate kinase [Nitrospira sp.]
MPQSKREVPALLIVNAGSSSVKWALFHVAASPVRSASGRIERIGIPDGIVSVTDAATGQDHRRTAQIPTHAAAVQLLIDQLEQSGRGLSLQAIGHRVVHGGSRYTNPEVLSTAVMEELRRLSPYDPEHLPAELTLIEALAVRYPAIPQVACFDTGFHQHLPPVARLLAIPRRYEKQGVRRYGFHGLSYAYLMEELERVAGSDAARGNVILAHLGNGASLAAVRDGVSIDTTMGFTPASGLPMSTRSGDLDPGLISYLSTTEGMTAEQFHHMVHAQSGLLGLSELSPDLRDLLAQESCDTRAAEAVAVFCYHGKKWIGAYAAALGGLDQLVFSGGIGEHSSIVRARMCDGLAFLGIQLDQARNGAHDAVISAPGSRVTVRVIHTDEERHIAQSVCRLLALPGSRGTQ